MTLTPEQKRILLVLCNADERHPGKPVRLVTTQGPRPIRETSTGAALVRKGLAVRTPSGRFSVTLDGFWMGDALRIEDRQGKVPARRRA